MKWFKILALTIMMMIVSVLGASAEVDISSLQVDTTPTKNLKDLFNQSTLIILGRPDSADTTYPTKKKVQQYQIVNFVQTVQVKKPLKGTSSALLKLLTTGTDPLPPSGDALNKLYPGPLAEGDYFCFLKQVPGTDLYTLIGGWQGVYPIFQGKTVALKGFGYPEFNGLSVEEFERRLHDLQH